MTIKECALDVGKHERTIRRWMKSGYFSISKIGLREIFIEPEVWAKFCSDNNIKRRGK